MYLYGEYATKRAHHRFSELSGSCLWLGMWYTGTQNLSILMMDFFEGRFPLAIRLVIRAVNMEICIFEFAFWKGA